MSVGLYVEVILGGEKTENSGHNLNLFFILNETVLTRRLDMEVME